MLLFLQWLPFLPASRPEQLNKKRPATVWQPEDLAGMPRLAALARLLLLLPLDWLLALLLLSVTSAVVCVGTIVVSFVAFVPSLVPTDVPLAASNDFVVVVPFLVAAAAAAALSDGTTQVAL
mmetsp:Transcript_97991/g.189187  ORF Transcript_97991/g.189187 Transcript_97991/m.189187 type:complete len:122 (-) Transcript_97991:714-1079(-)|eukprot:CAMPEP_0172660362 /NCGR_PEP_ID=MMETSP1074-20121228/4026_1 /TAXON_ID=2916 /ORGANISM="Ceratium fusus, Strain PA161109" /LENGTH=121 /DNA_ID=CAMNT_0013475977 /DNA_START=405 /DNA_END=770 /DNA_ORIENTATION=-